MRAFFLYRLCHVVVLFRLWASYFFLRGQEKVTKKKATPAASAFGSPALLAGRGGAGTRPCGLRHPAPFSPDRLRCSATQKGLLCGRQRLASHGHSARTVPGVVPLQRCRLGACGRDKSGTVFELRSKARFVRLARASWWSARPRAPNREPEGQRCGVAQRRNAKPLLQFKRKRRSRHAHTRPVKSTTRATSASVVTPSFTRATPSSASGR